MGDKGGPILVKSFVQKLVTTSSTEAELLALVDGVKKSLPILKLLEEITGKPLVINAYQDNKSTIMLATGGEGLSGKSKHYHVRYHFLKELIDDGKLKLTYVSNDNMVRADVLTKPLSGERFRLLRNAIIGSLSLKTRGIYKPILFNVPRGDKGVSALYDCSL